MKTNFRLFLSFLAIFACTSALGMEQTTDQKSEGEITIKDVASLEELCIDHIKSKWDDECYVNIITETMNKLGYDLQTKFYAKMVENLGKTFLNEIYKTGHLPKYLSNLDKDTHELLRKLLFKQFILSHIIKPNSTFEIAFNQNLSIMERQTYKPCTLPQKLAVMNTSWSLESLCYALAIKKYESKFLKSIGMKPLRCVTFDLPCSIQYLKEIVIKNKSDDTLHLINIRHLNNLQLAEDIIEGKMPLANSDRTKFSFAV